MEKNSILYSVCLNQKNINALVNIICEDIKLSERSIPKCSAMIEDIMKKNISKLSRQPKNRDELKEIIKYLNKLCIDTIIETIAKKYPDVYINKKKQIGKEQMRRNLDVYGNREVHVQDRPHIKARKGQHDDETFYNMSPNDIGYSGTDDTLGGYASAFGNHLITNVPVGQKQSAFNNPHQRIGGDGNQFEQRYQQMVNERNNSVGMPQRPETPDFTLDGSGEEVRRKKMMRKMEQNMDGQMGMGNMGMGGMMGSGMPCGMGTDDIYASLLGAGAPNQQMFPQQQNNVSVGGMGMGNPLLPLSSTNMMADQFGMNSMGGYMGTQSVKSMQLQNDYERKMAERKQIDLETNQPQGNQSGYGNQSGMMPGTILSGNMMQGNMFQMNPQMNQQQQILQMNPQMQQMNQPQMQQMNQPQMNQPMQMNMQLPMNLQNLNTPSMFPQMTF